MFAAVPNSVLLHSGLSADQAFFLGYDRGSEYYCCERRMKRKLQMESEEVLSVTQPKSSLQMKGFFLGFFLSICY